MEDTLRYTNNLVSKIRRGYDAIQDKFLELQVRALTPGYTTGIGGGAGLEQLNSPEQNVPPERSYLKSAIIGGVTGGLAGLGIHYLGEKNLFTDDSFVNWWQSIAGGAVLGAGAGVLRTASKIYKKLKPVYYGMIGGLAYGLFSGGFETLIRNGAAQNGFQSLFTSNQFIESLTGLVTYAGRITSDGFAMHELDADLNLTHRAIENAGLWALVEGVTGLGYNGVKKYLREKK